MKKKKTLYMSLGSKKENGKLIFQFNVSEEDFKALLEDSENVRIVNINGNKDYDNVRFELTAPVVKKTIKTI